MKARLVKIERFWTLIIERADGTKNDYRFDTKAQARKWAVVVGIKI